MSKRKRDDDGKDVSSAKRAKAASSGFAPSVTGSALASVMILLDWAASEGERTVDSGLDLWLQTLRHVHRFAYQASETPLVVVWRILLAYQIRAVTCYRHNYVNFITELRGVSGCNCQCTTAFLLAIAEAMMRLDEFSDVKDLATRVYDAMFQVAIPGHTFIALHLADDLPARLYVRGRHSRSTGGHTWAKVETTSDQDTVIGKLVFAQGLYKPEWFFPHLTPTPSQIVAMGGYLTQSRDDIILSTMFDFATHENIEDYMLVTRPALATARVMQVLEACAEEDCMPAVLRSVYYDAGPHVDVAPVPGLTAGEDIRNRNNYQERLAGRRAGFSAVVPRGWVVNRGEYSKALDSLLEAAAELAPAEERTAQGPSCSVQ